MNSGFLLIAVGDPARDEASRCIETIHRHEPDAGVHLLTRDNLPPGVPDLPDRPLSHYLKTLGPLLTPFQHTLQLDADTRLLRPCLAQLRALHQPGHRLLIAPSPSQAQGSRRFANAPQAVRQHLANTTHDLASLNTAVLSHTAPPPTNSLSGDPLHALARAWGKHWLDLHRSQASNPDQPPLLLALQDHPLPWLPLDPAFWNTPAPTPQTRIHHLSFWPRRPPL